MPRPHPTRGLASGETSVAAAASPAMAPRPKRRERSEVTGEETEKRRRRDDRFAGESVPPLPSRRVPEASSATPRRVVDEAAVARRVEQLPSPQRRPAWQMLAMQVAARGEFAREREARQAPELDENPLARVIATWYLE